MSWKALNRMLNIRCMETFGVPIVYIPSINNRPELEGVPVNLNGVFSLRNESFSLQMQGSNFPVDIARSSVEICLKDLGITPMDGDEVTMDGSSYSVIEVQPNGKDLAILFLKVAQDTFSYF